MCRHGHTYSCGGPKLVLRITLDHLLLSAQIQTSCRTEVVFPMAVQTPVSEHTLLMNELGRATGLLYKKGQHGRFIRLLCGDLRSGRDQTVCGHACWHAGMLWIVAKKWFSPIAVYQTTPNRSGGMLEKPGSSGNQPGWAASRAMRHSAPCCRGIEIV